ncbi:MerR family transcriptional regulator [Psychromonas sp. RZ22]|uniref:MerR family DNA-binding protein n=1 Tax=Psychromonas algarum TaxID=2555643 RepID=UPI001067DBA3|nr:MerR family DNA-binding protein [Psychromonas sp. RZ22]TEW56024.1 MerR family transcriptional regulator [Psychromonas sp. RZ22]
MLSISQASKETGLSVKSIRHYESIGLIDEPPREHNDYRFYPNEIIKQLHFIQKTKLAGFTLKECKALLLLCEDEQRNSADVKKIALEKIQEIEQRIQQQQEIVDQLKKISQLCPGDDQAKCSIIDAFTQ